MNMAIIWHWKKGSGLEIQTYIYGNYQVQKSNFETNKLFLSWYKYTFQTRTNVPYYRLN